jgi:hypothetical protein
MKFDIKHILFDQYLVRKGLITYDDVINARIMQYDNNRKIGDLANDKGWLSYDDIRKILIIQEGTKDMFCEVAMKEGYVSKEQTEELLKEQKDNYLFFGEALIKLNVITEEEMLKNLKEFNMLKCADQSIYKSVIPRFHSSLANNTYPGPGRPKKSLCQKIEKSVNALNVNGTSSPPNAPGHASAPVVSSFQ